MAEEGPRNDEFHDGKGNHRRVQPSSSTKHPAMWARDLRLHQEQAHGFPEYVEMILSQAPAQEEHAS